MKKLTAFVLSLIMALSLCVPAMAADVGSDADEAETQAGELPDGCDEHPITLRPLLAMELFLALADEVDFDKEFAVIYEQLQELDKDAETVQLSAYSMYVIMLYALSHMEDCSIDASFGVKRGSYWTYESPNGFSIYLYLKQNGLKEYNDSKMFIGISSDGYLLKRIELSVT